MSGVEDGRGVVYKGDNRISVENFRGSIERKARVTLMVGGGAEMGWSSDCGMNGVVIG